MVVLKAKVTTCEVGLAWGCQVSQGMKKCWNCCVPAPCCLWRRQEGTRPPQHILVLQGVSEADVSDVTYSISHSESKLELGAVAMSPTRSCLDVGTACLSCCHLQLGHSLSHREERRGACKGYGCSCLGSGSCVLQPRVTPGRAARAGWDPTHLNLRASISGALGAGEKWLKPPVAVLEYCSFN